MVCELARPTMKKSKSTEYLLSATPSWLRVLPEEIWVCIYSHISLSEVGVAECVSSQWQRLLAGSEKIWFDLLVRAWSAMSMSEETFFLSKNQKSEGKQKTVSHLKQCIRHLPRNEISKKLVFTSKLPSQLILSGRRARWLGILGSNRSLLGDRPLPSYQALFQTKVCVLSPKGYFGLSSVAYFEVCIDTSKEIISSQEHGIVPVVAIGIGTKRFGHERKLPGWCSSSIGLHGDDGCVYHNSKPSHALCDPFDQHSQHTIGCGLIGLESTKFGIFFTHNGSLLYPNAPIIKVFEANSTDLYPVIGLDSGAPISVNFGQASFRNFDPTVLPQPLKQHLQSVNAALTTSLDSLKDLVLPSDALNDHCLYRHSPRRTRIPISTLFPEISNHGITTRLSHRQNLFARHVLQFAANLRFGGLLANDDFENNDDEDDYDFDFAAAGLQDDDDDDNEAYEYHMSDEL